MSSSKLCGVCFEPAEKCCSACGAVSYCSVAHQKSDWKNHKTNCKAYKVGSNDEIGRHLVATRDLKAGNLVLKERPISSAPKVPSFEGRDVQTLIPVCLGCYCIMYDPRTIPRKCSKCNWPICSPECEKIASHSENECQIFSTNKITFEDQTNDIYMDIFVLRTCLLKLKTPKFWSSLMNLQFEKNITVPKLEKDKQLATAKLNANESIRNLKLSDKVEVEDWMRVFNVICINAFGMNMNYPRDGDLPPRVAFGSFVGSEVSMLTHSCAPNCTWGTSPAPNMAMEVRTAVDIVRGEIFTISYSSEINMVGTHERQKRIPDFLCKCIRCVDPTELGSQASTFVCSECKSPSLVSTNPLEKSAPWKCGSCLKLDIFGYTKLEYAHARFLTLQMMTPSQIAIFNSDDSDPNFHPNHWVLTEEARKLVRYLGDEKSEDMTNAERDLYISKCKYLLKVVNITAPGVSRERSQLKHFIAKETLNKAMEEYSDKKINLVQLQQQLNIVSDMQEEAYKFFKTDCSEARNGQKGPVAVYLEKQMDLVKGLYSGRFKIHYNDKK